MEESRKSKEIDVIGICKILLSQWRFILKVAVSSTVIGIVVALNIQKHYTTEVILAPEISSGGLGLSASLSDMASSFGIDIGTMPQMDALYPEIYPDIFASTDFIINLFDIPVKQEKDSTTKTYRDHLLQDSKTPFWRYPLVLIGTLFKEKSSTTEKFNPFNLSRDDELLCEAIRGSINCQIDKKTSVITIRMTDIDRQVSAIMADTLLSRLQSYITNYRTSKARNDLKQYEKFCAQSKQEYLDCQQKYASFSDSHLKSLFQSTNSRLEELENEMNLKYQAYSQMEQQVRMAKTRVQEVTPAFTVIQNATVPNRASSTPRTLIVVLYMFLGCVGACFWTLFKKDIYNLYKFYIKNKNTEE